MPSVVTGAIIYNDNTVLLARRKTGQKLEGHWEFPGGKLEKGETLESCLERELYEEFGIKSKSGRIIAESIYEYSNGTIRLVGIESVLDNHNFILTVHDKVVWTEISKILDYKLAPADIPIAKKIMEMENDV